GRTGEDMAAAFLKKRGLKIIARNFRAGHAEIDVVALDGRQIVFVEVKTRSRREEISPRFSITARKRSRIVKVAQQYLKKTGCPVYTTPVRFDVVTVELGAGEVDHLPGAFRA
ncbi:MAG TPA: YraN family protein, partial [bacterium]|nr:YraN family protein [bacterium]